MGHCSCFFFFYEYYFSSVIFHFLRILIFFFRTCILFYWMNVSILNTLHSLDTVSSLPSRLHWKTCPTSPLSLQLICYYLLLFVFSLSFLILFFNKSFELTYCAFVSVSLWKREVRQEERINTFIFKYFMYILFVLIIFVFVFIFSMIEKGELLNDIQFWCFEKAVVEKSLLMGEEWAQWQHRNGFQTIF